MYIQIKDLENNYKENIKIDHKKIYKFLNKELKNYYIEIICNNIKYEYIIKCYDITKIENNYSLNMILNIKCYTKNIFYKVYNDIMIFNKCLL